MPLASPRKYSYLPSGKARRELARTLATEIKALVDQLGPDHPERNKHILRYIEDLDRQHPEWAALWDRATKHRTTRQRT